MTGSHQGPKQLYDLAMAVGNNLIRGLTNGVARPDAIYLGHRRPDDVQPYESLLKVPLRFDQSQTCLILSRTSMSAKIPGANPDRRKLLLDQLSQIAAKDGKPNSARIRHMLRPQFLRGDPSMASLAAMLRTSVRSLGRALAREETGFEALRDEVRFGMACELLELTELKIGDIGDALAFSSHSSFEHAFRRWSGMSPSDWRKAEETRSEEYDN